MLQTNTERAGSFLKSIDLFGHSVELQSNNKSYFTSTFGAIISFGILVLSGIYATNKFRVLKDRGDTTY